MEKQIRYGFVGLLGTALSGGCRVCPPGYSEGAKYKSLPLYTEEQDRVCVKDEKREEVLGNYTFDEVYSLTTSLVTTLDAVEACAGFSGASVNDTLSAYEGCTTTYAQLQDNLPVFSPEDTVVNAGISPLQVFKMGTYSYSYFTGSALSVEFEDLKHSVFLSGAVYILEDGCKGNVDHYYSSFVCYSSEYEKSTGAQQGCTGTMDHLHLHPASSFCGIGDLFGMRSGTNEFKEELVNEDLILLHYDYARALEELVLDVERE